jgi:hypothetical protein
MQIYMCIYIHIHVYIQYIYLFTYTYTLCIIYVYIIYIYNISVYYICMRAKTYSLTHATRQSLRKDTRTTRLSLSVSLCLSVSLSLTYSLCDTRATRPSRASTLQISGIPPSFLFPKKKKYL